MAKFVTRSSLIHTISEKYNLSHTMAEDIVQTIFEEMTLALESDGQIDISKFGKFYVFDRKARMGINPITKEKMEIQATKLPKFKPSKTIKDRCNQ